MRIWSVLLLLLSATPAWAWGAEGHEVIAHLAAMNLTPQARAGVAALLGGETEAMMALNANWADEVRDDRPDTAPWHYVNLEIDGDLHYRPERDCPLDDCVVAQIARDEAVLQSGAPAPRKAEALRFLIHLAGDIRQPLHAADRHDQGGNGLTLYYRGRPSNLHHVWDDDVVAVQGRDPLAIARAMDRMVSAGDKVRLAAGAPADWAEDSARLARDSIYAEVAPGTRMLPGDYAKKHASLALLQLAKAGYSLAALLNAAFR